MFNIEQRWSDKSLYVTDSSNSMIAANHPGPSEPVWLVALRALQLFFFLLLIVAFAHGQASPPAAGKSVQSGAAPVTGTVSPEVSKYVGPETCKTCHEEIYNAWEKTPRWKTTLNKKGDPSKQGCEGCHGPGGDHVAGGGDKTKIFEFEGKSRQD